MSSLQETLKESLGIDVRGTLGNMSGKSDYARTIEKLRYELAEKRNTY